MLWSLVLVWQSLLLGGFAKTILCLRSSLETLSLLS